MPTLLDTADALAERVADLYPRRVPQQVLLRVASLAANDELVHVDVQWQDHGEEVHVELVALTEHRVIHATANGDAAAWSRGDTASETAETSGSFRPS